MKLTELRAALRDKPPEKRPSPKICAAIEAAFAEDAAAAYEALVGGDAGWMNLSDAPGCPWSANDTATMPWLDALPNTLAKELRQRCQGLITRQIGGRWHLGYVLERGTAKDAHWYLGLVVGGPPSVDPTPSEAAREKRWQQVPEGLRAFYAVHDGFGVHTGDEFGVEALLPAVQLEVVPAVVGKKSDGSPMLEPTALLAFYCDSVGNRRGFYRQDPSLPVYAKAADWDHETKQVALIGKPMAIIARELVKSLREG